MMVAWGIGGKVTSCVPRLLELIHLSDFLDVQAELSKSDMNVALIIARWAAGFMPSQAPGNRERGRRIHACSSA